MGKKYFKYDSYIKASVIWVGAIFAYKKGALSVYKIIRISWAQNKERYLGEKYGYAYLGTK